MPAQLSTILYISEYREKTSGEFFIGMATGCTRLEGDSDATQEFNITVFYPLDEEKPCYVPKLEEGQVLSIANSKFAIGSLDNQIDLILTSATILPIKPEDLPIHNINVVGTALVSDSVLSTNLGIQFECIISDYMAKDRPTETPVILFHPNGSRLKNQTTMLKRGSSIFFSGTLILIEGKFYLELHNLSFIRTQQSNFMSKSPKEVPWSSTSSSSSTSSTIHKKIQEQQQSTPILGKREITTKKFHPTKLTKLSDIESNPLIVTENSMEISEETSEEIQEQEEQEESASAVTPIVTPITTPTKKRSSSRAKKV